MSPHQATSGSPGAKSWLTRSGRGGLSSDQSVVRIRLRSMTRAAASVRNSFGYLPRRRPGVGLSSVTTGMTTSYSRCPASGGMLRASQDQMLGNAVYEYRYPPVDVLSRLG